MAVKQKLVECVPQTAEARLQVILRALQEINAQGLPDKLKMCAFIVSSLGTIHIPTSAIDYVQYIRNIKRVQENLAKECIDGDLISATLSAFYREISASEQALSPAMSIVLQLVDVQYIAEAVDVILLQEGYTNDSLKRALMTLCQWLIKWTYTENLGPLVLAFMKGLELQQHHDILLDVTLATIEPLFRLLILHDHRKCSGDIVIYMLELNNGAFTVVAPHILEVLSCLQKENTEHSLKYLQEIVRLSVDLIEKYQSYPWYSPLKKDLDPYLSTYYKKSSNDMTWMDDDDDSNSVVPFSSISGRVGLNNLGNTCYMNSVLQALFMTKPFRNEVLINDKDITTILPKLQMLFALLNFSKRVSLSPTELANCARPPGFLPGYQHDSSEFLGYLLDVVHEQERSAHIFQTRRTRNENVAEAPYSTIVQKSFGGTTVTVSRCGQCDNTSERIDNFRELQLAFPNNSHNQSVQNLLDYYLESEQLSGDNQYHCETCDCLTDGERTTFIKHSPPRLILTLKHFRYDPASQQRTKLLQSVHLDNRVHLKTGRFELYAAVVHCGSSVDSGHYYTFAKEGSDWYKFNDCTVTRTTAEELHNLKAPETPYILFYKKEDSVDPDDIPLGTLSKKLRVIVEKDNAEFELEKKRRVVRTYNTRQKRNDEPPPPGCGGGGFGGSSSNMYVC